MYGVLRAYAWVEDGTVLLYEPFLVCSARTRGLKLEEIDVNESVPCFPRVRGLKGQVAWLAAAILCVPRVGVG